MKKEKIQYIFIGLVGLLVILSLIGYGYYSYQNKVKWDGYRADERTLPFVEEIDEINSKENKEFIDYLELGNNYNNLGEYRLAIKSYKEALDILPDSLVTRFNIANAYQAQGEYKNAQDAYLKLLEYNKQEVGAYQNLSNLYKLKWSGKKYDSLSVLLKGLESNPNSYNLLIATAEIYKENQDIENALVYYNKALGIRPDSIELQQEIEALK